ncbi:MAG: phage head closure protein [Pseudomonadota bacterium]
MTDRMRIDPGKLNRRVLLEEKIEIPDGCGGLDTSWTTVAEVWAMLQPLVPRSFEEADQLSEEQRQAITIRYRSDVASGWRITESGRHFEILTVHDPDERQRYLICTTKQEGR